MSGKLLAVHFQQIIELISVIIWPVTFLIIIFKFKTFFGGAINRMQSINASATGLSMTFENKIDQAKALLVKLGPQPTSKAKSIIIPDGSTPYSDVLKIKTQLEKLITEKAEAYNISSSDKNPMSLTSKLAEIGLLTLQQARAINAALDIANSADKNLTASQADIVQQLYDRVTL
ncbi:MAG: hypothetical protein V7767_09575 [Leeuwenhoekiella sp.]